MATLIFKVSDYSTSSSPLAAADAAATSANGALIIDYNITLSANITLSSKQVAFAGGVVALGNFNLTFSNNALSGPIVKIFDYTGSGIVSGTFFGDVHVEHFGAFSNGTNGTITRQAFQHAFDYTVQSTSGGQTIYCLGPSYLFDGTSVIKTGNFHAPSIKGGGIGEGGTTISFSPTSEAAAIVLVGGAGSDTGASIEGISFTGNSNTIGVELRDQCGVTGEISCDGTIKMALLYSSYNSGGFAESNVISVACAGMGSMTCILEMRKVNGTGSFANSGLGDRTQVVVPSGASSTKIVYISSASCECYNAVLEGVFFNSSGHAVSLISNLQSGFACWFAKCNVHLEFNDSSPIAMADPNQNIVYFKNLPHVQGSHACDLSNSTFCDYVSYDSSVLTRKGACYQRSVANIGAADNTPLNIPAFQNPASPYLTYHLYLENGPGTWQWQGKIITAAGAASADGGIQVIGSLLVDTVGWGLPNFDCYDYIGQLRLKSFTGTPTHIGIFAEIETFSD